LSSFESIGYFKALGMTLTVDKVFLSIFAIIASLERPPSRGKREKTERPRRRISRILSVCHWSLGESPNLLESAFRFSV